jgi:hypothetical protein
MAENLKGAIQNIGNTTIGALEVSKRAVDQSVKLAGIAVNQGGVVATAAVEGAGAVATSAIQNSAEVATSSLTAAKDISKVGLKTTTNVVSSAEEITTTAATVTNVTPGTVGEVAKDANKTVQLSSKLATGLTNNVLEGVTNMSQLLDHLGDNRFVAIRDSQESTKSVLMRGIGTSASTKQKLDIEFNNFVKNMRSSIKDLIDLQSLGFSIVRIFTEKFYCTGIFDRLFRSKCPPKAETNLAKSNLTKYFQQLQILSTTLIGSFEKLAVDAQSKIKLIPITDTVSIVSSYKAIFIEHCVKVATAMEIYTSSTNAILVKHNDLYEKVMNDKFLGGRRKLTRRRRYRKATLRSS